MTKAMKKFCENEFCENPGAKVVAVSVDRPADQGRTLCAACEESFSWGVQHGTLAAREHLDWQEVQSFLLGGFIVLTRNVTTLNRDEQFEAWAYSGVLNFETAASVTFGLGASPLDALAAVNHQIKVHAKGDAAIPTRPLYVDRRELATILAALRFYQDENLQHSQEIPDVAISEIATDGGLVKPLSFQEVSELCERLNVKRGGRLHNRAKVSRPHPAIQQIHDLLYLDIDGPREFYSPEKAWNADTLEMVAKIVARYIPRPKPISSDKQ
jgi:hypothetical protein